MPLEQLALGWLCLGRSLREAGRLALHSPTLWLWLAQCALVTAIVFAAHPLFSTFMAPLLRAVSGDDALRYPELYRRLPGIVSRLSVFTGAVLEPLAAGAATRLFTQAYEGRRLDARAAWGEALACAPALVLTSLPLRLLLVASDGFFAHVLTGRVSLITRLLAPKVAVFVNALMHAVLLLLPPLVILERRGPLATFAALPEALVRAFLPALVLAVLLALPPLPFEMFAGRSVPIVAHGLPERVALVVLARSAVLALCVTFGAGAAALLHRVQLAGRDEDAW